MPLLTTLTVLTHGKLFKFLIKNLSNFPPARAVRVMSQLT